MEIRLDICRRINTTRQNKFNAAFCCQRSDEIECFIQHIGETDRFERKLHRPGFDPADIEDFVNQIEKVAAGAGDVAGTSSHRPGWALSFDELAKAQDCI